MITSRQACQLKDKPLRLGVSICLDLDRHLQKVSLYSREILDSLKNDILTNLDEVFAIKSQFLSIFYCGTQYLKPV